VISSLTTPLAFLFVLGVLVFVHELGHFLAARRVGVRVLTFSLGFGPKILKFTRGDTEYCLSVVPLGGYVKMAGENPDDPRSGQPDEFLSKTKWQRFQILIMGPVMNIVLAVVVLAIVLAQGAHVAAYREEAPVVGVVVHDSPAERAGLMVGDLILAVGQNPVETWQDLLMRVATKANRDIELAVKRGGQTITVSVRPSAEGKFEIGTLGVLPDTHPIVASVIAEGPAAKAGLKAKDVILAINGEPMVFRTQLITAISNHGGQNVELTVKREEQTLLIRATPVKRGARGMMDMYLTDRVKSFTPGPLEAVKLSIEENIESSGLIFTTLTGLFTGETSVRQLQGPVGIAQLSGESAAEGWVSLFSLMAMLSINLGILNLMPIPVLDGGHILILMLEGIARRDFSMRVKEKMLLAGFVLLMMLMVTVIYNDLTRISWVESLMPWRN
jgi:regulator of sigma E protease